mgnify:CR=1 FL=1
MAALSAMFQLADSSATRHTVADSSATRRTVADSSATRRTVVSGTFRLADISDTRTAAAAFWLKFIRSKIMKGSTGATPLKGEHPYGGFVGNSPHGGHFGEYPYGGQFPIGG